MAEEKRGSSSMRPEGKVAQGELKFTYGSHHGRQCIIDVDGAWKQVRRKNYSKAGIGWVAKVDMNVLFSGNCMVKANSALQCEGLVVLSAIKVAQKRREMDIKILSDSETVIRSLNKKSFPFHIVNICNDVYDCCRNLNSYEVVKVDRNLVKESHDIAIKARQGVLV